MRHCSRSVDLLKADHFISKINRPSAIAQRWQSAGAGLQAFRWIALLDDHFFLSVFSSCVMDLIMFGPMYVCRFTTRPSQTRKPQYGTPPCQ
jgi:hypothetical protein